MGVPLAVAGALSDNLRFVTAEAGGELEAPPEDGGEI